MQFVLSLLLDVGLHRHQPTVAGVNHLPFVTELDVDGEDGFALLRDLLDHADERARRAARDGVPRGTRAREDLRGRRVDEGRPAAPQPAEARAVPSVRRAARRRRSSPRRVLPRLPHRGVGLGRRGGASSSPTIEERERWQGRHIADFEAMLASDEVVDDAVGRDGRAGDRSAACSTSPGWFPLNIPNDGQVADLPDEVVVESMCMVDGAGVRGRDEVVAARPRSPSSSAGSRPRQELTVEAARHRRPRRACSRRCSPTRSPGASTTSGSERMTDEMLARDEAAGSRSSRERPSMTRLRDRRRSPSTRSRCVCFPTPAALADAAADAARPSPSRAASTADGVAHAMFATGNSQLAFLDGAHGARRRRLDAASSASTWTSTCGIDADHPGELPPLPARAPRRAGRRSGAFHEIEGDAPDLGAECARYAGAAARAPARPLLPRHRRERPPRVQRSARRRLRRSGRREGRRARRRVPPPAGRRGPLRRRRRVPTHAITVTIPALLRAGAVLAIVPEARKASRCSAALDGPDRHRVPGVDPARQAERDAATSTPTRRPGWSRAVRA